MRRDSIHARCKTELLLTSTKFETRPEFFFEPPPVPPRYFQSFSLVACNGAPCDLARPAGLSTPSAACELHSGMEGRSNRQPHNGMLMVLTLDMWIEQAVCAALALPHVLKRVV